MKQKERFRVSMDAPLVETLDLLAMNNRHRGRPYTAMVLQHAARRVERLTAVGVERLGQIAELEAELADAHAHITGLQDDLAEARAALAALESNDF